MIKQPTFSNYLVKYFWFVWMILISNLISSVAHAAIYRSIDTKGNVIYSDQPLFDSQIVHLPPVDSYQNQVNAFQITSSGASPPQEQTVYKILKIANILDQQTFYNQPQIPVKIIVDPPLQKDDKIQIVLDGKVYGVTNSQNELSLDNIARGTHHLQAILIQSNGKILLSTAVITIYVHRTSVNPPAAPLLLPAGGS